MAPIAKRILISQYQFQSDYLLLLLPLSNLTFQMGPQQCSQWLEDRLKPLGSKGNQNLVLGVCRPPPEPRLVYSLKRQFSVLSVDKSVDIIAQCKYMA